MAATKTSELQPLLPHSQVTATAVRSDTVVNDDSNTVGQPANGLTWRWYACYGLLFALTLIALTLLIKGFIDAGDQGVSIRGLVKLHN